MKKLSLKNLKLEANDMLQRNQLKTVFGGYSSEACVTNYEDCEVDHDCSNGCSCDTVLGQCKN